MITTENIFTNYPDVVSTKQIQEMLHIGRNTAYKLLEGNAVSSIKIERTHKILKAGIIDYLNKGSITN